MIASIPLTQKLIDLNDYLGNNELYSQIGITTKKSDKSAVLDNRRTLI